jgi:hypothetical protein
MSLTDIDEELGLGESSVTGGSVPAAESDADGATPDDSRGIVTDPVDRARLKYLLALVGVTFGLAGTFLAAVRGTQAIREWLVAPVPYVGEPVSVWLLVAVLPAVVVAIVYGYPFFRPDRFEDGAYRRVERVVRYALYVAVLVGGLFVVVDTLVDSDVGSGTVAVALVLGLVAAFGVFGPYPSGAQRQYELAIDGYRNTLASVLTHLTVLSTEDPFVSLYRDSPQLQFDVEQAKNAVETANARLDVAQDALDERLYEAYVFHYQAAKRELITVEYAVREFEAQFDGLASAPYAPDGGRPGPIFERVTVLFPRRRPVKPDPVPNGYLTAMAERVTDWADENLSEDRAAHVRGLLTRDGVVRQDLTPSDLRIATARVHDHLLRTQQEQFAIKRLMRAGTVFGVFALGSIFVLADSGQLPGVVSPIGGTSQSVTLAIVALFGFLGAVTSSLFTLTDVSAGTAMNSELTNPFLNLEVLSMRLVVGATAGILAAVLLASSLPAAVLNPGLLGESSSTPVVVVAAFAAGFTERLVLYSVERIVGQSA